MNYVKFFLFVTGGQLVLLFVAMGYDWFVGLPDIGLSSPADIYWWPLAYGNWGHASFFIAFVGPLVLFGYSILATMGYVTLNFFRYLFTRKD